MNYLDNQVSFGDRKLVGQHRARRQVEKILRSERLGHAYLLTGPDGIGKTAFSLAFAEAVNGIDNISDLKGTQISKKSGWYTHPDIHIFLPLPSNAGANELQSRLKLLADDPYEIVDFSLRPALTDAGSSKNRRAFYSIEYFSEEIRPKTFYKPNEGRKVVVIIAGIDTMRKESANAFLKLLEEPSDNILFLLTASKTDRLLPTIVSRCQHIRLNPLTRHEITEGLIQKDGFSQKDADYLARLSDGNYALTRFYDISSLQKNREELINFLRYSYSQDIPQLLNIIRDWNSKLNLENQIALTNSLEQLLRDILVYAETSDISLITNADQIDVIERFCSSMKNAMLPEMIEHTQHLKQLLFQNVQFKFIFTSLSLRFAHLMRGLNPTINNQEVWKHLPAYSEL